MAVLGSENAFNKMIFIGMAILIALIGGSIMIKMAPKMLPMSRIVSTAVGAVVKVFAPTPGVEVGG